MQIGKSCSDLFKGRIKSFAILILFRMDFFGAADGWGGKPSTVMPYLKKIQKIYEPRDTPLEFCRYQRFFDINQQILLNQEIQI